MGKTENRRRTYNNSSTVVIITNEYGGTCSTPLLSRCALVSEEVWSVDQLIQQLCRDEDGEQGDEEGTHRPGRYLFGDYSHFDQGAAFWQVLEAM